MVSKGDEKGGRIMNFHKSIPVLAKKIEEAKNKDEAIKIVEELLNSYHIQTESGIRRLDAFENSILNPSLKFKRNILEKHKILKKGKWKKFLFLFRYEELIKKFKSGGASQSQIAKYLNSHRTPKRLRDGVQPIKINKMDISRFIKERGIE